MWPPRHRRWLRPGFLPPTGWQGLQRCAPLAHVSAPPDPEEKEKKPLTVNDLLKKRKKKNNQFDIKAFMFFECINDKIEAFLVSIAKFPGTSRTPQGVGWDRDRVAPSPELRGRLELPAM